VIVSGVLSRSGPPGGVLGAWRDGAFEAVSCGAHVSEVARTLVKPHLACRITAVERADLIAFLVNRTRFVPDRSPDPAVPLDPGDDYLVALARDWGAALVTGDRHLLDLPGMPGIITPRRFLQMLA
jgi:predicted nucleic acid-binding protein